MHSSWTEGVGTAHFDYKCQQKSIIRLRPSIKSYFWKICIFPRDKVKQSACKWNKFDNLQTLNVPRPTWLPFERTPHSALFFHLFCWIILHKFEVSNLHHPATTTILNFKAIYACTVSPRWPVESLRLQKGEKSKLSSKYSLALYLTAVTLPLQHFCTECTTSSITLPLEPILSHSFSSNNPNCLRQRLAPQSKVMNCLISPVS